MNGQHMPQVACRTESRLADGRPIIFFDDVERGRAVPVDLRQLEPRPAQAELRRDPLTGEWVAIAAHRQSRTFLPSVQDCPLCPGGGEIPAAAYDVVVFENRWPSFSGTASPGNQGAAGQCEVIAFTDEHTRSFGSLDPRRVSTVIAAWADRSAGLAEHPDIRYVACFENRGEQIGVTLHHPHGQIYGYPFVPPVIEQLVRQSKQSMVAGTDLFSSVLAAELDGPRVVAADDHWVAYVPLAARWPYELVLLPRREVPNLEGLDDQERSSLADLMPAVVGAFDRLFDAPVPYIGGWRQSPVGERSVRVHWRLFSAQRAAGKLKYLAGSEAAYGAYINDVSPEDAAQRIRKALAS